MGSLGVGFAHFSELGTFCASCKIWVFRPLGVIGFVPIDYTF